MLQTSDRRAAFRKEVRAATGIDEAMIARLIHGFYARVRQDAVLGPIFAARVADEDWPHHLERMVAFWSSVMLMSGRYRGQPVQAHAGLGIHHAHFERWLAIFREAARDLTAPAAAARFIEAAERIGASLQAAVARDFGEDA